MNRLQNANSRATAFVGKHIDNALCHDCRDSWSGVSVTVIRFQSSATIWRGSRKLGEFASAGLEPKQKSCTAST
jgi:hypothetical protein